MRRKTISLLFMMVFLLPAIAGAASEKDFEVQTTENLINLCTASPDDPLYHHAINFCHGYLVGAFHYYPDRICKGCAYTLVLIKHYDLAVYYQSSRALRGVGSTSRRPVQAELILSSTGKVYRLKDIADFPGKYSELRAGITVVEGVGGYYVRNDKGVGDEVRSFILTFHSSLILFVNFKDLTLPLNL